MPRFKVTVEETARYTVEVNAPSEAKAAELAEAAFTGSITCPYPTEVTARDVVDIQRMHNALVAL
jgi:hypothetical protein